MGGIDEARVHAHYGYSILCGDWPRYGYNSDPYRGDCLHVIELPENVVLDPLYTDNPCPCRAHCLVEDGGDPDVLIRVFVNVN